MINKLELVELLPFGICKAWLATVISKLRCGLRKRPVEIPIDCSKTCQSCDVKRKLLFWLISTASSIFLPTRILLLTEYTHSTSWHIPTAF